MRHKSKRRRRKNRRNNNGTYLLHIIVINNYSNRNDYSSFIARIIEWMSEGANEQMGVQVSAHAYH